MATPRTAPKTAVKVQLSSLTSKNGGGSTLTEVARIGILDVLKAGNRLGKLWYTKAKQWTDDNGDVHEGIGGKPGIHLTFSDKMKERYDMEDDHDTVVLWFHSSAKELLEQTGGKLHKRMSLLEVKNEETEQHSFMIIEADSTLASDTTVDDIIGD